MFGILSQLCTVEMCELPQTCDSWHTVTYRRHLVCTCVTSPNVVLVTVTWVCAFTLQMLCQMLGNKAAKFAGEAGVFPHYFLTMPHLVLIRDAATGPLPIVELTLTEELTCKKKKKGMWRETESRCGT